MVWSEWDLTDFQNLISVVKYNGNYDCRKEPAGIRRRMDEL